MQSPLDPATIEVDCAKGSAGLASPAPKKAIAGAVDKVRPAVKVPAAISFEKIFFTVVLKSLSSGTHLKLSLTTLSLFYLSSAYKYTPKEINFP